MANTDGIQTVVEKWAVSDVSTVLFLLTVYADWPALDCILFHHGLRDDCCPFGVVSMAGRISLLPSQSFPKGRTLAYTDFGSYDDGTVHGVSVCASPTTILSSH